MIISLYNFSTLDFPQNSDTVQFWFQSPEQCIIKHLKNTELYCIEILRIEMTTTPKTIAENTPLMAYILYFS